MRFTVEQRADRLQRHMTGPWRTDERSVGPVGVQYRYRRQPRIEFVRLWVAVHDLERVTWRPFARWLLRLLERA